MWKTQEFNDPELWPEDGSQPFVLSTGDSTGYGQHGDYVFGWEGNSLQKSMDSGCYLRNCSLLTEQVPNVKNACNVPVTVDEDIDGCEFFFCYSSGAGELTIGVGMNELPGGGRGE